MNSWLIEPIFASPWVLAIVTVILLATPWLVPVAGRTVEPKQQRTIAWLRTATSLVLLLAVFRPALVRNDSLPTQATLALLVDRSRSMTLPADEKRLRYDVQNELLAKLQAALSRLDDSLELVTLTFAGDANVVIPDEAFSEAMKQPPSGIATDIGAALAAAIQTATGKPLAGIVLLGDGVPVQPSSPDGKSPATDPQSSARLIASLDVPLWPVPIGPPADRDQVRDAELAELAEAFALFSGNESAVNFVVRTQSLVGTELDVRILLTPEFGDAKPLEIATRKVTPTQATDSVAMSIPITAPAPGAYRMEVRVAAQPGETLLTNNSQVAFVDVRQGGGRVLYLEGQPRPEQSFLMRSLRSFPDLQVSYRWIAGDTMSRWPIDLSGPLSPKNYDVIVLGDLPAAAIGDVQMQLIADRVAGGAALVAIGGAQAFVAGEYASSPLAAVLPVKLDNGDADFSGDVRALPTQLHPITQLASGSVLAAQTKAWNSLPTMIGASQFAEAKIAPGVEVLLETADGDPLLVVGEYGGGRVAAFAGDSTWRWWRQGKSVEHRRFWRQMLLWTMDRQADATDGLELELAKRRIVAGESLAYTVIDSTPDGPPAVISIVAADGTQTPVQADVSGNRGDARTMEGNIIDLVPGLYRLQVKRDGGDESAKVTKSFQFLDQDGELRIPYADHAYLQQLASQTAASGGAMFLPTEIDGLIDLISQLRRTAQSPVVKKYRLGDTPQTAWPLFVALAVMLGVEWYLRRRWGLA